MPGCAAGGRFWCWGGCWPAPGTPAWQASGGAGSRCGGCMCSWLSQRVGRAGLGAWQVRLCWRARRGQHLFPLIPRASPRRPSLPFTHSQRPWLFTAFSFWRSLSYSCNDVALQSGSELVCPPALLPLTPRANSASAHPATAASHGTNLSGPFAAQPGRCATRPCSRRGGRWPGCCRRRPAGSWSCA